MLFFDLFVCFCPSLSRVFRFVVILLLRFRAGFAPKSFHDSCPKVTSKTKGPVFFSHLTRAFSGDQRCSGLTSRSREPIVAGSCLNSARFSREHDWKPTKYDFGLTKDARFKVKNFSHRSGVQLRGIWNIPIYDHI